MYRKFRNVPIFEDIPPICPYFLVFRVGKYVINVICHHLNYVTHILKGKSSPELP